MKNTVALVSGANRGIGKQITLEFAKKGFELLLLGRNKEQLIQLQTHIQSEYPETKIPQIYLCDFQDLQELKQTLEEIVNQYPQIDILVNNAGKYMDGSLEGSIESFKDMMDINLNAPLLILKHIVPLMKQCKKGYIFNIASRAGKIGFAHSGFYVASKFGLVGLSESLYRELCEYNIKVTAICPSYVNTDMAFETDTELKGHQMIQTKDIANTLDWLLNLSPSAFVREVVIDCQSTIN